MDGPNICPHIFSYTFFLLRSTSSPDFEIQALFEHVFFRIKSGYLPIGTSTIPLFDNPTPDGPGALQRPFLVGRNL